MGIFSIVQESWFQLIEPVGITGGLFLNAYVCWKDVRARRVSNSIAILDQYQRIWREPYDRPHLLRIMAKEVDLEKEAMRFDEEIFVTKLVLLMSTVYRAIKHGELMEYEGLPKEAQEFFPLPIPKLVWEKIRDFQDREFIEFVEQALK